MALGGIANSWVRWLVGWFYGGCFGDRVSIYSHCYPGTHYVEQAGLDS